MKLNEVPFQNFESLEQCSKRQLMLLGGRARIPALIRRQLKECEGLCDRRACCDACHFGTRAYRLELINGAGEVFEGLGPAWAVTIVHPKWSVGRGELEEFGVRRAHQWLSRRLSRLGSSIVAVGAFERSLNFELDGSMHWAGEIHVVVAGATDDELAEALKIKSAKKWDTPVMILPVDDLKRQVGYATKRRPVRRIAYVDETGRQNRRELPLTPKEQAEHDEWLAGLRLGSRVATYGCRRNGTKLHRTTPRSKGARH